ncbi:MAG: hypothetical protein LBG76_07975 [Treponema sp.]|nr:hypothetical protein [Treponema sp.]
MARQKKYSRNIFARILPQGLLILLALSGCTTVEQELIPTYNDVRKDTFVDDPRIPLTMSIIERLKNSEYRINDVCLFGQITLERVEVTPSIEINTAGKVLLKDTYIKVTKKLDDQDIRLLGRVINDEEYGRLSVCFDTQDTNNILTFSSRGREPDGLFYLEYTPGSDPRLLLGDEKGIVEYGGKIYRVKFTGDRPPFLLIKLSQKRADWTSNEVLSGRRAATE